MQVRDQKQYAVCSIEIFTIFWGASWQQDPSAGILTQMNQFFDFVLTSSLIDQLSEYSVVGQSIGHEKRTGSIRLSMGREVRK
jgi:hypothetical protein